MGKIDQHIDHHEHSAWSRYSLAVSHLPDSHLPAWLDDFIERNAMPLLVSVGFDPDIARTMFRIAAPAWKSMKQAVIDGPTVTTQASLDRDIRSMRRDMYRVDRESSPRTDPVQPFPGELASRAAEAMRPENLAELLRHIPTTWIILPRAHAFLTRSDSSCLILYLRYLNSGSGQPFEKLITRVLIEYFGNYTLKFISPALPRKQMTDALFYGYAAMFWKNLRNPPAGLEDLLVFRNFQSWARGFVRRSANRDSEKEGMISAMEETGDSILPDRNQRGRSIPVRPEAAGFHITLRHGRPGINDAVRYFSPERNRFPEHIWALFRELQIHYAHETQRTREFIHTFLEELKGAYLPYRFRAGPTHHVPVTDRRVFSRKRMAAMVGDFSRTLH